MWIFIWIVISAFVLGVFFWSSRILMQQKHAWKAFAQKTGLTYQEGRGRLSSPSLSGVMGKYNFGLFTEVQQTADARGQRYSTILEISLRQGLPVSGAIGTKAMVPLIETLRMDQSVSPQNKDWDPGWIIRTRHAEMMEHYLTPARLDILSKVFRLKILSALFIFDTNDAVLRIETADPLNKADRLEKIVKGLTNAIDGLTTSPEEYAVLNDIVRASPPAPLPELPVTEPPKPQQDPASELYFEMAGKPDEK